MRLSITLVLDIDEADYATAYGLSPEDVVTDAQHHMEATVTEVTCEQLKRLGYGEVLASRSTVNESSHDDQCAFVYPAPDGARCNLTRALHRHAKVQHPFTEQE